MSNYRGKPYPTQQHPAQQFHNPSPPMMQYNQGPYNVSPYPPQQSAGYPPQQSNAYPIQQNTLGGAYPPASAPAEPPPPYYPTDPYAQQYSQSRYPNMPPMQSSAYPPQQTAGYQTQPLAAYPAGVQVTGQFDSSARFGSGATHNIPPPPPGVMPNAAQVANMSGAPVQMTQRPAGWFSGHTDGGMTFW